MKKILACLLILVLVVGMLSVTALAAPVSSPEDMPGTPVGPTSPQTGVEGNLVLLAAVAVVVLFGAVFLLKKSYAR